MHMEERWRRLGRDIVQIYSFNRREFSSPLPLSLSLCVSPAFYVGESDPGCASLLSGDLHEGELGALKV